LSVERLIAETVLPREFTARRIDGPVAPAERGLPVFLSHPLRSGPARRTTIENASEMQLPIGPRKRGDEWNRRDVRKPETPRMVLRSLPKDMF
jgi:hypothetical protein